MILSSTSVMFMTQRTRARATAGDGRAGRRRGTSGSCRCGPGRRRSDRRSTCGRVVEQRNERPGLARQRVVESHLAHRRGLDRRQRQRRDRPPGALGALEVARRRLDAHGIDRESSIAGDRVPHRIEPSREPRPRGRRSSGRHRPDASRRPEPHGDGPRAAPRCRCPWVSRAQPGTAVRGRRGAAAPSSASATAWSTTSPSE